MEQAGNLFVYDTNKKLCAFESGPAFSSSCVVFIAGMTEGFQGVGYLKALEDHLRQIDYSLVQVLLSSSYSGYGCSSLQRDTDELDQLISLLLEKGKKRIILMGHSTGAQDTVWYARFGPHREDIFAYILQGAASDRQYMEASLEPALLGDFKNKAADMIKNGKPNELMPRNADSVPITAYRYHSLAFRGGDDDMFSSDLSDDELSRIFGGLNSQKLAIFLSGKDEYIPPAVDKEKLLARILNAKPGFKFGRIIAEANHAASNSTAVMTELCTEVINFINSLQ